MTGAKQIMQAQAVNNHNIANLSTIGFRADTVAFDSQPIYGPAMRRASMPWPATQAPIFPRASCRARAAISTSAVNGKGFIAVRAPTARRPIPCRRFAPVADGRGHDRERIGGADRVRPFVIPPSTQVSIGGDGTVSVVRRAPHRLRSPKSIESSW